MKSLYKTLLISAVMATLHANNASGLDIVVETPGTLSTLVSEPANVKNLSLRGSVNASDLYFIGERMTTLTVLDLGATTITAYEGDMLNGRASYPAGMIPRNVFSGMPLSSVTFPATGKLTIDDAAFMGTDIVSLRLPDNVDSVGIGAFAASPRLASVTYPTAAVGRSVFADCPALVTVETGTATKIAPEAFRRCVKLATVNGSEQLTDIGDGAFEGCTSLRSFVFGSGLRTIGARAFAATGLENIASLANASGISTIGEQVFANIPTLTTVALPANATRIADGAFFDNSAVTVVSLPSGLTELGNHAMKGMSGVTGEVVLPGTLEVIGDYAMAGMTGISGIDAEHLTAVPETGIDVWRGIDKASVTLTVLKDYESDFRNAAQWQDFAIKTLTGNIDAVVDATPNVRGRFVGTVLEVVSTDSEMTAVRLFNAAGALLATVEPQGATASIETAPFAAGTFIVTVSLQNGMTATLKTARN